MPEITNRLFDYEHQALDFLTESRALVAGALRLIVDSSCHVTPILQAFQARHPNVRISLKVGNPQELTDALYAYHPDVGVLGELSDANDLEVVPLGATPLLSFAAKGGVRAILRIAVGLIDEVILAQIFRTRSENPWGTARDAVVLYGPPRLP
ncbi:MAG: substrate-binding domain-containing protein [Marinosulfonomonas sp.]|nr:substrate-binding domain-containing protein [Marinosulfonomonas sp.]